MFLNPKVAAMKQHSHLLGYEMVGAQLRWHAAQGPLDSRHLDLELTILELFTTTNDWKLECRTIFTNS